VRDRAGNAAPVVPREASGSNPERVHIFNKNRSVETAVLYRVEIIQTVKGGLSLRIPQDSRLVF
jgi:hypothetical protein